MNWEWKVSKTIVTTFRMFFFLFFFSLQNIIIISEANQLTHRYIVVLRGLYHEPLFVAFGFILGGMYKAGVKLK